MFVTIGLVRNQKCAQKMVRAFNAVIKANPNSYVSHAWFGPSRDSYGKFYLVCAEAFGTYNAAVLAAATKAADDAEREFYTK